MSPDDIVRMWKDPEARVDGDALPHPAGEIDLQLVHGGNEALTTWGCLSFSCTNMICTFESAGCPWR